MPEPTRLGIEIGGTKLQLALGRGDGHLMALRRRTVEPSLGAEGIRRQIAESWPELLGEADLDAAAVVAAGVGFGGPVDAARGIVTTSHQISGWDGFALADWVREALGVSVAVVANDADAAALGEARFGAGVGRSPVLYVTVGSGIGGGLVVDGRIYRGSGAGAAEIGHLWIDDDRQGDGPCRFAELETIASGWAIGVEGRHLVDRALKEPTRSSPLAERVGGDALRVTAALVAAAAAAGDREAAAILDRAARAVGRALAQAVALLAPQRIILGGGVSLAPEGLWLDPLRRELDRLGFAPFRGTFDVVRAALDESVVLHGALALARDVSG